MTNLGNISEYIWFNGDLIKGENTNVHILTHSLHYAGAAFEGEKAYNGKIFKLQEHTHRLINSAKDLAMESPYSFDDIISAHQLLIDKNQISNAYLRPLIWRGAESLNITNKLLSYNLAIIAVPSLPKHKEKLKLHISKWRKPPPNSMPPQCKSSGHYNMMMTVQYEAKNNGYDDAILLDQRGYIAECTTSNIFFVQNNDIITPIADSFLNGITRQTVIQIAKKLGMTIKEKHVLLEDVKSYNECFVTGTAIEVHGVSSINITDQNINFFENSITQIIKTEYNNLIGKVN